LSQDDDTSAAMSDIARKTLPSRSASKYGPSNAKTPDKPAEEDKTAPRSAPSPPQDIDLGKEERDETATESTSDEYTHRADKDLKDDKSEVEESRTSESRADEGEEAEEEEPINLKDNDEHSIPPEQDDDDESYDHMKDVEPKPTEESVKDKDDKPEKEDEAAGAESKAVPESQDAKAPELDDKSVSETKEKADEPKEKASEVEAASNKSEVATESKDKETDMLTEAAKRIFDQASENQPTDEARESFLRSAGVSKKSDAPTEKQEAKSGASEATQDKAETEAPSVSEKQDHEQSARSVSEKSQDKAETEAEDAATETEQEIPQDQQTVTSSQQEEIPQDQQTVTSSQREEVPQDQQTVTSSQREEIPQDQQTVTSSQREEIPQDQQTVTSSQQEEIPQDQQTVTSSQQEEIPQDQQTVTSSQQEEIPQDQQTVTSSQQYDQQTDAGSAPSQAQTQSQYQGESYEGTQPTEAPEGTEAGETNVTHLDFGPLKSGTVNKMGNVISPDGKLVGRVVSGILSHLIGKKSDENGQIWSSSGQVIGQAEPISDDERDEMLREPAPFESFPDAVVDGNGMVVSNGEWVGKVTQGDVKVLRGKSVDPDGDILDKAGNVIGKAERWEPEPEEEEEEAKEVDNSLLAGKRVNKAGNVVDSSGTIYGRVVEGDVKRMIGRMCDKNGNILSESGDVLGRAELVSEGEREGMKEGPFAELQGCTVAKDGTVVTPSGDIVGRLIKGDGKVLYGRSVDEDGDVLDRNGNIIGKAERWEPEAKERTQNPMTGRKVNKEGNVVDADGNVIGKLTSGDLQVCSGKEIDDDGDVVDHKGTVIGHCSLLEDIPKEEEPQVEEESPEDKAKREQAEQDRKLAIQMAVCIEQCLDKIRPICKMITEKIDKAERTPEDERDEEALVREVRPLIEEGGRILTEAKGIIKGLDPDGRISANAKHKTAAREATPEEYHLADVLKDLTGDVTQCIENGKKKLEDMPHAKKEINPLWGLLNEPLFQILAAVGLLLTGVLNLVGRLLSGLGLGGLVDGLLGTLGLNRVLGALGLGSFSESLKGGKKKGGGLLGGILGGGK